jgi:hypothetical protein
MGLTIYQKSIFLILLNATMILRSVGKTMKDTEKLRKFKIAVFKELEKLTDLINENQLKEEDVINSIERLSKTFAISFGQAQKAINVMLKYYFHLFSDQNNQLKEILHCPIDAVILKKLNKKISLTKIDKTQYLMLQEEIKRQSLTKIDFDISWDKQHLNDEGIGDFNE